MSTPKDVISKAAAKFDVKKPVESAKEEAAEPAIKELIERVFGTRNLVHFAHWQTGSVAQHMALGDLYDAIVGATDDIVENYQGEFGLLSGLECCECKLEKDIVEYVLEDANWVRANQDKISRGSKAISSLVDVLMADYNKAIYKLKNLK